MKKLLFSLALLVFGSFSYAQSTYEKSMAENIAKLTIAKTPEDIEIIQNNFTKISESGHVDWHLYYYTSLSYVLKEKLLNGVNKTQGVESTVLFAQKNITPIIIAQTDNSEVNLLLASINLLKMSVSPSESIKLEGKKVMEYIKKVEKNDPNNPRLDIVRAEMALLTPENLGGGKKKAILLLNSANKKLDLQKPNSSLDPTWGKSVVAYYLSTIKP